MTPSSLTDLTLAGAADALRRRDFSAVELTEAHIRAIELQRGLNAFITETPDLAIAQAKASDERLAKGEGGALEGLPFGIKDLFCTQGIKTTAGSHMLDSFVPPYESTVTAKLWDAGAVCLGKLNLDEFAMGSSNATSYFGPVRNPWTRNDGSNTPLVPGGSSGGSAAAVSARIVLAATGTDTGGSIRQPAGLCGIVGLKPTYGRCSRWGTIAFASSLDQAGPMTRTVEDAALMLGVIAGHDPKDSTSAPVAVPDYRATLTGDLRGLKVGVPTDFRVDGLRPEIDTLWQQGLEWLRDAGAEPVEINLPLSKYALAAYYVIAPAEASANLARYDGVRFGLRVPGQTLDQLYENTRAEGFGAEVKRRILIGTYVLSAGYYDAYYLKAQRIRALITREYETAFRAVDVILTPTTPTPAFELGVTSEDPLEMYLNDVFTVPVNLAGLPGLSVPAGFSPSGLPLGLQIIGKAFDEATVLRVGQVIERAASLDLKPGKRS